MRGHVMDFYQAIESRHSVRKYLDKPVPEEIIRKIVGLARKCPSWANIQPIRYHCVYNAVIKEQLGLTSDYNKRYMDMAATVVVVSAVLNLSGADSKGGKYYHSSKEWTMFDAGIASYGFCLAAHDLGVGTVILGDFDGEEVRRLMQFSDKEDVVALIAMGYPQKTPRGSERHEISEILTFVK